MSAQHADRSRAHWGLRHLLRANAGVAPRPERMVFLGLRTYGGVGGIQAFNQRVIRTLVARAETRAGAPPLIVLRDDVPGDMPEGLNARFRPCGRSRARAAFEALKAMRGADLILLGHINLLPFAAVARWWAPRAALVLFAHGVEVWGVPRYRRPKWYDGTLLRRLDKVVSVSAFTARRAEAAFRLWPDLFSVFANAVDAVDFAREGNAQPQEFLSVARLTDAEEGKNIDKVLRAVARIAPQYPGLRYTVIGEGALRTSLMALATKLGIADRVHFAGRVDQEGLNAAYARACAFVLPSEKEGFGIVFLEAWQRRLPVICGNRDAACEIVSDNEDGFVVDPADIAALADRMAWLIDHPAASRAMGDAGHTKVQERYLMANFAQRLDGILDLVLRGRG